MKIDSSSVNMASARTYGSYTRQRVSLMSIENKKLFTTADQDKGPGTSRKKGQSLEDMLARFRNQGSPVQRSNAVNTVDEIEKGNKIRQHCIRYLLEIFLRDTGSHSSVSLSDDGALQYEQQNEPQKRGNGFYVNTLSYQEEYYHSEHENTAFSTTGKVVTSDGREISFHVEMQMSRSFETYYQRNYEQSMVLCDPLVINLDGDIAEVSDQKFLFDLDADGEEENISYLKPGSGYLALDKNGDGQINDGGELFGTRSGDGFKDLMRYDEDGNGWIDENDAIFHKLVIWAKDENGNDQMYRLADQGIGAICLQNVSTDFALKSQADNSTNALIRKTGIFLYENGSAGTVQHLDMAT